MSTILFGVSVLLWLVAGALLGGGLALFIRRAASATGSALPLVLGLVGAGLIVGAFVGVVHYSSLVKRRRDVTAGWNPQRVVVTVVDVTPGQLLTFDLLSVRSFPEQFITPDLVLPDEVTGVVNATVAAPLAKGDAVPWAASCAPGPRD